MIKGLSTLFTKRNGTHMHTEPPPLHQDISPSPLFQEAYENVCTNLLYALPNSTASTFVFSSEVHHPCKSTVTANIALHLAAKDFRVLLIDSDWEKPNLHTLFGGSNQKGLSSVLGGFSSLSHALLTLQEDSLYLLTAGPKPPDGAALIASSKMEKLLSFVHAKYDYILIDAPPLLLCQDALHLGRKSAGVVLVIRQKYTLRNHFVAAISALGETETPLLGVIMASAEKNLRKARAAASSPVFTSQTTSPQTKASFAATFQTPQTFISDAPAMPRQDAQVSEAMFQTRSPDQPLSEYEPKFFTTDNL